MTIGRSPNSECPEWSSDGPATREGSFYDSVAAAYRLVEKSAKDRIVDSEICCHWHRTMFARHVPLSYYAGNYRQVDPSRPCLDVNVWVAGQKGADASEVPETMRLHFEQVRRILTALEVQWPSMSAQDRAKRCAVTLGYAIGQFIKVHPFVNGNGRTSRLLWAWGLIRFNVPPQVRIRTRPENPKYAQVMAQAMSGNFAPLALFILTHMVVAPPALELPPQ